MLLSDEKRRSLTMLMVVQLTTNFRSGIVSPILALFVREQGLTIGQIGLLGTAGMLGWLIFEPLSGVVADRVRKKFMIIFAVVGSTIVFALYPSASNFWEFAALTFVRTSVMSAYAISVKALTAELLPKEERGKAYGRYLSVISFGGMIAPFLGGYISETSGYAMPFYLSAGIGVVALVAVFMMKYDDKAETLQDRVGHDSWRSLLTASILSIFTVRALYLFNLVFRQSFLPIYLNESPRFNASETQIGAFLTIIRVSIAASQALLGDICDRFGGKIMIVSSVGLMGLSYLGLVFGSGIWLLYGLGAVQGILMAAANMSMMIHLMAIMPESRTGMVMGLYSESENIGGMIASPSLGFLYEGMGAPITITMLIGVLLATAVVAGFVIKNPFESTASEQG